MITEKLTRRHYQQSQIGPHHHNISYEPVDTDQEFTLSELEDVLSRLKDTTPGDDTVGYLMIKNAPLATRNLFLRLSNQSLTEGRLLTKWPRLYRSQ